ncbi:hypothetical protein QTO17_06995 [Vibrio owensii]
MLVLLREKKGRENKKAEAERSRKRFAFTDNDKKQAANTQPENTRIDV